MPTVATSFPLGREPQKCGSPKHAFPQKVKSEFVEGGRVGDGGMQKSVPCEFPAEGNAVEDGSFRNLRSNYDGSGREASAGKENAMNDGSSAASTAKCGKQKIDADSPLIFSGDYGIMSSAWSSWDRSRTMTKNGKPEGKEWHSAVHSREDAQAGGRQLPA